MIGAITTGVGILFSAAASIASCGGLDYPDGCFIDKDPSQNVSYCSSGPGAHRPWMNEYRWNSSGRYVVTLYGPWAPAGVQSAKAGTLNGAIDYGIDLRADDGQTIWYDAPCAGCP